MPEKIPSVVGFSCAFAGNNTNEGYPEKREELVAKQNAEANIQVRQVTNVQASWVEGPERGAPGTFTIQLILDDGAEEYVLQPTAEDAKVQIELLGRSGSTYFDLGNKVLIPSSISLGGTSGPVSA